jgi:hypothetical protein
VKERANGPSARVAGAARAGAGILERTGLTRSTLYNIRKRAEERGYDKDRNFIFRNEFFEDNRRLGRAGEKEGKNKKKIFLILNSFFIIVLFPFPPPFLPFLPFTIIAIVLVCGICALCNFNG